MKISTLMQFMFSLACHTTILNINHVRVDSGFLAVMLPIVISWNVLRCPSMQSINSNKLVYDGTSLWSLLWFCQASIAKQDRSNFNSMTDDTNISNEWSLIAWCALICCFTTSRKWHSSWPFPLFNEGASTMARTWACWINRGLSYCSRRQSIASA